MAQVIFNTRTCMLPGLWPVKVVHRVPHVPATTSFRNFFSPALGWGARAGCAVLAMSYTSFQDA